MTYKIKSADTSFPNFKTMILLNTLYEKINVDNPLEIEITVAELLKVSKKFGMLNYTDIINNLEILTSCSFYIYLKNEKLDIDIKRKFLILSLYEIKKFKNHKKNYIRIQFTKDIIDNLNQYNFSINSKFLNLNHNTRRLCSE